MKHASKRHGQTTVEYAVLLAIVISAMILMQIYVKRASMGRMRTVTDQQLGRQWDPFAASGSLTLTTSTHQKSTLDPTGHSTNAMTGVEKNQRVADKETVEPITNDQLFD